MFHFYVLSFFKKGATIQGGTLFKEIWYILSIFIMAVRGRKHYSEHTLWHFHSMFESSLSAISQILEPRPKVLLSSIYYNSNKNANKQKTNK